MGADLAIAGSSGTLPRRGRGHGTAAAGPGENTPPFFVGNVGHLTAKTAGLPFLSPHALRGLYRLFRNVMRARRVSEESLEQWIAFISTSLLIATAAIIALAQGVSPMNPNLRPPHRPSRSLARPAETEKDMWRAYLIAAGTALGLIAVWAMLVSFTA